MWMVFMIGIAALSFGLGAWISVKSLRNKPGVQPRIQNFYYCLLSVLATLLVWVALRRMGIDIFKPRTYANTNFWIFLATGYWFSLVSLLLQRPHAGALVVDIAPPAGRKMFLALAALTLLSAAGLALDGLPGGIWRMLFQFVCFRALSDSRAWHSDPAGFTTLE